MGLNALGVCLIIVLFVSAGASAKYYIVDPYVAGFGGGIGDTSHLAFLLVNGSRPLSHDWDVNASLTNLSWLNATWLNASGLNVQDLNMTTINGLGYLWNGFNCTDVLANPVQPVDYIIGAVGSGYCLKNCSNGQVSSSLNASLLVHFAWGNLSRDGTIHFKSNVFQDVAICETLKDNVSVTLEGEGIGTVLNGTANKIVDLANDAWGAAGEHMQCINVRDITFTHYTPNNGSVTVDLWYGDATVANLWIINKNATRQGTGLLVGPHENNGRGFVWGSTEIVDYAVAYHVELDHVSAVHCHAIRPANIGFFFKLCSNTVFTAPFVYAVGVNSTTHPFWMEQTGWGMEIDAPCLELGSNLNISNAMFTENGTSWMPVMIRNADADQSGILLTNSTSTVRFHFQGSTLAFPLYATGYNATANNAGYQTHGLCLAPSIVCVMSGNTTTNVFSGSYAYDSNLFRYRLHDDAGNAVTGQTVYWFASAES